MTAGSANPSLLEVLLLLVALAFIYQAGNNPLWLSGAFLCFGVMLMQHPEHRSLGIGVCICAALYFAVVSSYYVGKDMAARDNVKHAAHLPGNSSGSQG